MLTENSEKTSCNGDIGTGLEKLHRWFLMKMQEARSKERAVRLVLL